MIDLTVKTVEVNSSKKNAINIPKHFLCPITHELMSDPVIAADGETYERETITKHIKRCQETNVGVFSPVGGVDAKMGIGLILNRSMLSQIKEFLTKNPSCAEEEYFQETLLGDSYKAMKEKNIDGFRRIIENDKRVLEKVVKEGKTLVEIICEEGLVDFLPVVLTLIKKYYPKFSFTDVQKEKLLVSCFKTMPQQLLTLSAEFNWTEKERNEFIIKQIKSGHFDVIEALSKGNLIKLESSLDEKQNTAIHIAVLNSSPEMVKKLIGLGANSKSKNGDGFSCEQLAVQQGFSDLSQNIANWRRNKKLEPMKNEFNSQIEKMQKEIQLLISENKYQRQLIENTNLSQAKNPLNFFNNLNKISNAHDDFVKIILEGDLDTVKKLHQAGALLTEVDKAGYYPLVAAAYSGNPKLLAYIEEELHEKACEYWQMIDVKKVQAKNKSIIEILKNGYGSTNEGYQQWCEYHSKGFSWQKTYEELVGIKMEIKSKELCQLFEDWDGTGFRSYCNQNKVYDTYNDPKFSQFRVSYEKYYTNPKKLTYAAKDCLMSVFEKECDLYLMSAVKENEMEYNNLYLYKKSQYEVWCKAKIDDKKIIDVQLNDVDNVNKTVDNESLSELLMAIEQKELKNITARTKDCVLRFASTRGHILEKSKIEDNNLYFYTNNQNEVWYKTKKISGELIDRPLNGVDNVDDDKNKAYHLHQTSVFEKDKIEDNNLYFYTNNQNEVWYKTKTISGELIDKPLNGVDNVDDEKNQILSKQDLSDLLTAIKKPYRRGNDLENITEETKNNILKLTSKRGHTQIQILSKQDLSDLLTAIKKRHISHLKYTEETKSNILKLTSKRGHTPLHHNAAVKNITEELARMTKHIENKVKGLKEDERYVPHTRTNVSK